jgi:hypothetical protein
MSKEEKTLIINNTRPSQVELPGVVNDEGVVQEEGLKLLPGENDVPVSVWDRVKEHKTIKMWMGCGILEEKGPGQARKLSDGLDALEKHEVILQIGKCESVQILKDWIEKTKDEGIRKKCRAKIDKLIVGKKAE